jgi:hypothetical protein
MYCHTSSVFQRRGHCPGPRPGQGPGPGHGTHDRYFCGPRSGLAPVGQATMRDCGRAFALHPHFCEHTHKHAIVVALDPKLARVPALVGAPVRGARKGVVADAHAHKVAPRVTRGVGFVWLSSGGHCCLQCHTPSCSCSCSCSCANNSDNRNCCRGKLHQTKPCLLPCHARASA